MCTPRWTAVALLAVALAGCGGAAASPAAVTTTVATTVTTTEASTVTVTAAAAQPAAPPVTTTPAAAPVALTMPNLVGQSLNAAEDAIKAVGVSKDSVSHDVSGKGRTVLLSRNWQVCNQKPAKGAAVQPTTTVEFGVVKFGEKCA